MTILDSLIAYQAQVDQLSFSPYLDYPAHVHLETYALCNAACSFCPYPGLERKGTRMPDRLIEKIVDDLTGIPAFLEFQISPFKVNEPFLDTRLFAILALINRRLPQAWLTLTTNGSPVTEEILERLARVQRLRYLWISVNESTGEAYERTMGLPFDRTCARLERIHAWKASGRLQTTVVLSRVASRKAADVAFEEWVRARFPAFHCSLFGRGDWLGQVAARAVEPIPDAGCLRWFELSVTATGAVAHCCMDGEAHYSIGDVNTNHALDIYNAPGYRRLRETARTRRDASPCRGCAFL